MTTIKIKKGETLKEQLRIALQDGEEREIPEEEFERAWNWLCEDHAYLGRMLIESGAWVCRWNEERGALDFKQR